MQTISSNKYSIFCKLLNMYDSGNTTFNIYDIKEDDNHFCSEGIEETVETLVCWEFLKKKRNDNYTITIPYLYLKDIIISYELNNLKEELDSKNKESDFYSVDNYEMRHIDEYETTIESLLSNKIFPTFDGANNINLGRINSEENNNSPFNKRLYDHYLDNILYKSFKSEPIYAYTLEEYESINSKDTKIDIKNITRKFNNQPITREVVKRLSLLPDLIFDNLNIKGEVDKEYIKSVIDVALSNGYIFIAYAVTSFIVHNYDYKKIQDNYIHELLLLDSYVKLDDDLFDMLIEIYDFVGDLSIESYERIRNDESGYSVCLNHLVEYTVKEDIEESDINEVYYSINKDNESLISSINDIVSDVVLSSYGLNKIRITKYLETVLNNYVSGIYSTDLDAAKEQLLRLSISYLNDMSDIEYSEFKRKIFSWYD